MGVEALTWSLTLAGPRPAAASPVRAPRQRRRAGETSRRVFDASRGKLLDYALFERAALAPGDAVDGPALIVEDQTTTVVSAAFGARLDARANLILERNGKP